MVSDSRCTHGEVCFDTPKICRADNALIGAAGDAADCERFLLWYPERTVKKWPAMRSLEALVLTAEGLLLYLTACKGQAVKISSAFYAIGSGAMAALGALHMGASPEEAVRIAALVSPTTGGPIEVLHLKENINAHPKPNKRKVSKNPSTA